MLKSFIEHVSRLKPEEVATLWLEDIALCAAWYQSYDGDPEAQKSCAAIPKAVEHWLASATPVPLETEGRRYQLVLRSLLDELQNGQLGKLERSQLDFLHAVSDLIERSSEPSHFQRVSELLAPHTKPLAARRDSLEATPGLGQLGAATQIVTREIMAKAPARLVKTFGGVEMQCRGHLLTCPGNVKVCGDVPEDCILVVDKGLCTVNGYVMGKVAAKESCEVRENIAGVVVVRHGAIRAKGLLTNTQIISKAGDVACRSAQDPKLVFAGGAIRIAEATVEGAYIAPRISIGAQARGGMFQASHLVEAQRFGHSTRGPSSVVLRHRLSCEDYGEYLDPEAAIMIAKAAVLRQELENYRRMIQIAASEIEHMAEHALTSLFGGDSVRQQVEQIETARRRLAFLDRIVAGYGALSSEAEDSLMAAARGRDASPGATQDAGGNTNTPVEDIESELQEISAEGQIDSDLSEAREEMLALNASIGGKGGGGKPVSGVYVRLKEKLQIWLEERKKLNAFIEKSEESLRRVTGTAQLVERSVGRASKAKLLERLLATAKEGPLKQVIAARAATPFVRLMRRSIESRAQRIATYRRVAQSARNELLTLHNRLRTEYLVTSLEEDPDTLVIPRVAGSFEEGVRICTDVSLLNEPGLPPGIIVTTRETGEETTAYIRDGQTIVESP